MNRIRRKTGPVTIVNRPIFSKNSFLIIFLLTLFALLHLMQRNSIKRMLIDISIMQKTVVELIQENKKLQVEMFSLSSPERISNIAEKKLKLTEPDKPAKVIYFPGMELSDIKQNMISGLYIRENTAFRNPVFLINSKSE